MQPYMLTNYITRILDNPDEIRLAQHLLFKIYVQEQNWHILPNNPSGLKVKTDINGINTIIDNFDKYSIWIGSFHEDKLIACGRIVKRDDKGLLEIERYPISNNLKIKICAAAMPNLIELNRSAILPGYRNTVVWPCLLHFGFEFCNLHQLSTISTTEFDKVKHFHGSIGFKTIQHEKFKYHTSDKKTVEVYLANFSNGDVASIIESLKKIIEQKLISVNPRECHLSYVNSPMRT